MTDSPAVKPAVPSAIASNNVRDGGTLTTQSPGTRTYAE